jgi:AcrR family transcriptional regulator
MERWAAIRTHFEGDTRKENIWRMPLVTAKKSEERSFRALGALFNRHGFDNVSVTQIMAGAGFTHGGFYSYFKSKNDLYN